MPETVGSSRSYTGVAFLPPPSQWIGTFIEGILFPLMSSFNGAKSCSFRVPDYHEDWRCKGIRSILSRFRYSSPSPDAPFDPGLVDVIHRVLSRPPSVLGSWWLLLADGMRISYIPQWGSPWLVWFGFARWTCISPALLPPPPYPTSHSPAWSEWIKGL